LDTWSKKEGGYQTKSIKRTNSQAYAKDIVLVDGSFEGLQHQIKRCEEFFSFANIKLNQDEVKFLNNTSQMQILLNSWEFSWETKEVVHLNMVTRSLIRCLIILKRSMEVY
jgi:hypothetical protein